jgi:ABC-2 type transport system permease protein
VLLVDQDGSAISQRIAKSLAADPSFALQSANADDVRGIVRGGDVTVAVVIPKGFGDAAGRAFFGTAVRPEVELLYDPSRAMEVGMVRGLLTAHVMEAVSAEMFGGQQGRTLVDETLNQLGNSDMSAEQQRLLRDLLTSTRNFYDRTGGTAAGQESPALQVPYSVREEAVTAAPGTNYNSYAHSFAGMGVQFVLFAAIDLGIGILLERQRGLWKRLRSAPVSRFQLLLGKFVSGGLLATLSLLVAFAFAIVVFGVRIEGSVAGFLGVAIACALMASSFGLMLAALGRTPNATRGIAILATLVMVMLGGAWVPTFVFPPWLQQATVVVPTRWAVDGLDAMTWRGLGAEAAIAPIAVMLGFAAIFGAVAVRRFRWEEA